jgi:predicted nucleic-acid-binding protein
MKSVDTNVLVRLIVRDDPIQTRSAERFIASGAWISHLVLAETIWVMESVYDRNPTQLATAIEMLLSHQQLVMQDADTVAAALESFIEKPRSDFSDHLILEIARKAGQLPLGTLDRNLSKLSGAELL